MEAVAHHLAVVEVHRGHLEVVAHRRFDRVKAWDS